MCVVYGFIIEYRMYSSTKNNTTNELAARCFGRWLQCSNVSQLTHCKKSIMRRYFCVEFILWLSCEEGSDGSLLAVWSSDDVLSVSEGILKRIFMWNEWDETLFSKHLCSHACFIVNWRHSCQQHYSFRCDTLKRLFTVSPRFVRMTHIICYVPIELIDRNYS